MRSVSKRGQDSLQESYFGLKTPIRTLKYSDWSAIANFIDFMRHKKQLEEKKVLKLQGILKDYDIDFSDLKKFKKQAWEHVEQEFSDG